MRREEKVVGIKIFVALGITIFIFTLLSIPLISLVAPLGSILFPGTGLWKVPGEVPESEILYVDGIEDEVIVYRDDWGIPHIYASNEADMSFALGYVHAQDRLFQMDMARRQVRGKLSEVVGDIALDSDKFNLAMGMEYWANETLKELKRMEKNKEIDYMDTFRRYVDGVNYYIETHKYEKPIEYVILGFEPTKWTLLDSLCFSKYMSKMLTWEYDDLYNLVNYEALGEQKYNELFNPFQPFQIPICPDYGSYNSTKLLTNFGGSPKLNSDVINEISNFLKKIKNIESEKNLLDFKRNRIIGSNNWVIDGVKSSSGKPILCNDMHLAWDLPGIWYEAHLVSKDTGLNTYGFTLAGVPIPIVAHNQYIAWGMTNTGYDVMDWYYYEETDKNHYIYNNTEMEYNKREYKIKVKNQKDVDFTVKETVHGPILNDFLTDDLLEPYGNKIKIAPRWTGNNITLEFHAIYGFNHAKNRAEFNESSKFFHNPAQNIIYADINGNIAIRPTGLVPIRNGNGTFPYDGSAGEGEWHGYIPILKLPHSENPLQHYLTSANQIVAGPNWNYSKYFLQNSYDTGYRARRINELLNDSADGTVGVEKMKDIQLDVKSSAAEAFTPYLINIIESLPESEKTYLIKRVLTELKNWDYKMDKDIAAPSIYRKWRDYFVDYTFNDEFEDAGALGKPQLNTLEFLMREDPNSTWFDDINTNSIVENRDDIIIKALEDAIDWLRDFFGTSEVYRWKWGKLHKVYFGHILGLESMSKGPFRCDGEGYTVNPSRVSIEEGRGYARAGASERMIIDFYDLRNSISCIPSGQRGLSNSKHYSDQLEKLFLEGKYHRHYFYANNEDFPKNYIESEILILPESERPNINIIFLIILIASCISGIIILLRYINVKKSKINNKLIKKKEKIE
ncbi:MAG: penicillin acylase family protein [Promethearchaeota archaeon]